MSDRSCSVGSPARTPGVGPSSMKISPESASAYGYRIMDPFRPARGERRERPIDEAQEGGQQKEGRGEGRRAADREEQPQAEDALVAGDHQEIGRASCRERG